MKKTINSIRCMAKLYRMLQMVMFFSFLVLNCSQTPQRGFQNFKIKFILKSIFPDSFMKITFHKTTYNSLTHPQEQQIFFCTSLFC